MRHTDTAISGTPQASDIDELPCSKYAASAMWIHNKLRLHHLDSHLPLSSFPPREDEGAWP